MKPLGEGSNGVESRKRSSADAAGGTRPTVRAWVVMVTDEAEGTGKGRGVMRVGGRQSRKAREENVTRSENRGRGGVVNQKRGGWSKAG